MDTILLSTSIGLIGLGAAIWRFKLIHLLSNVDIKAVDETKKGALARYAGCYMIIVGSIFIPLAFLTERAATEHKILLLVGAAVVVIILVTGFYLAGLGRYMKK